MNYRQAALASKATTIYLRELLEDWMYKWRLELALKSEKPCFSKEGRPQSRPIKLNGTELEVGTVLQIPWIDSRLQSDDLIVRRKQSLRIVHILSYRQRMLQKKCLTQIYVAFVGSLLDNSSLIYCYLHPKFSSECHLQTLYRHADN